MYAINQTCDVCGHFHKRIKVFEDDLGKAYYCRKCGAECCVYLQLDDFPMEWMDYDDDFFNPNMIYTPRYMTEQEIKNLTITKKETVRRMADSVIKHAKYLDVNLRVWDFNDPISVIQNIDKMMENVVTENYFRIATSYARQIYKNKESKFSDSKEEMKYMLVMGDLSDCALMELAARLGKKVGF